MTDIKYEIGKKFWTVENDSEGDIGNIFSTKADAVNMAKKMRADDKETGMDFLGRYSVLENIIIDKKGNTWVIDNKVVYQTR